MAVGGKEDQDQIKLLGITKCRCRPPSKKRWEKHKVEKLW